MRRSQRIAAAANNVPPIVESQPDDKKTSTLQKSKNLLIDLKPSLKRKLPEEEEDESSDEASSTEDEDYTEATTESQYSDSSNTEPTLSSMLFGGEETHVVKKLYKMASRSSSGSIEFPELSEKIKTLHGEEGLAQLENLRQFIMENEPNMATVLHLRNVNLAGMARLAELVLDFTSSDPCDQITVLFKFRDMLHHLQTSGVKDEPAPLEFLATSLADAHVKSAVTREYNRVFTMCDDMSEKQAFMSWLHWVKALPIHEASLPVAIVDTPTEYVTRCRAILDANLGGLQFLKDTMCATLHDRFVNPQMRSRPIGFIGPPGVGKTKLAKLVAECENRPLQRVSMGESNSAAGSNNMWVGASPGAPVKALCQANRADCLILIDEIDKMHEQTLEGLLLLLDYDNNHRFQDAYIMHFPVDFSRVLFVLTSNSDNVHTALLDRVTWFHITPYTLPERQHIIRSHIAKNIKTPIDLDAIDSLACNESLSIRNIESVLSVLDKLKQCPVKATSFGDNGPTITRQDLDSYWKMAKASSINHAHHMYM